MSSILGKVNALEISNKQDQQNISLIKSILTTNNNIRNVEREKGNIVGYAEKNRRNKSNEKTRS